MADSYLSSMPFSYSGLIEQLEFEGFSYSDAKFAADNCGANWYFQAELMAESHINTMSFSHSGLVEQLQHEGFSYDQAVHGVQSVGF